MTETYKFKFVNRVPVVTKDGASWMVDTGCPFSYPDPRVALKKATQDFHGLPGLRVMGLDSLRRYTKIDYPNAEIVTSDEPIEGGEDMVQVVARFGRPCSVTMTVGAETHDFFIDTGAAYSYLHNLSTSYHEEGVVQDNGFSGRTWTARVRRVPASYKAISFEVLCADALENCEMVPSQGVIGYDFFNRFVVLMEKL
ncbi:MAG: hypothetical protein Q4G65_16735 [bacterium]|nr:hypothetical protein [bacterium]